MIIAARNADVAQFIDFLAFGRHVVLHRRKIMATEVREDQKLLGLQEQLEKTEIFIS